MRKQPFYFREVLIILFFTGIESEIVRGVHDISAMRTTAGNRVRARCEQQPQDSQHLLRDHAKNRRRMRFRKVEVN